MSIISHEDFYKKFPEFNWIIYTNYNHDLKQTIFNEEKAIEHYNLYGFNEQRINTINQFYNEFQNFNWIFYRDLYDDVKVDNDIQAIEHFLKYGLKEKRFYKKENLPEAFPDFNWNFYVKVYYDLSHINNYNDAIFHYAKYGKKENRFYNSKNFYEKYKKFNWKIYIKINADLDDQNSEMKAICHFLSSGVLENRIYYDLNNFSVKNENILFVLGNGPSLKKIMDNPKYLEILKGNDTFALNSSYRIFQQYNFWPTYFGCFDYIVNESHKDSFEKLVLEDNLIKEFFFIGNQQKQQNLFSIDVVNNPRFINFNFNPLFEGKFTEISKNFYEFFNAGSSGANALQIGLMYGYKNIILLGCDCNYVEVLKEASFIDNSNCKLIITEDVKSNPNYWFDSYQQKGDVYNLPQSNNIQLISWENIFNTYSAGKTNIYNCSPISKIPFFKKIDFTEIITNIHSNYLLDQFNFIKNNTNVKLNFNYDYISNEKLIYFIKFFIGENFVINNDINIDYDPKIKDKNIFEIYYSFKDDVYSLFLNKKFVKKINELNSIIYNNKEKYKLSICIPICFLNITHESLINFDYVLKKFLEVKIEINVCISHTEKFYNPFLDKIIRNNSINYIFVKNPYNFNLGYSRNLWKYIANSKKIMFCDMDIPIDETHLKTLIDRSKLFNIVKPYDKNLIHLDKLNKYKYILENNTTLNIIPKCLFSITGGIVLFDKKVLLETGGYEEFNNYGQEDRCLDVIILHKKYSICKLDFKLFHLYHPNNNLLQKDEIKLCLSYVNKYYGCSYNKQSKLDIHENCNHKTIFIDKIISFSKINNGNLGLFKHPYLFSPNLKKYTY